MSSAIHTALSGLMAEARRLGVSAENVANLRSAGLDPGASAAAGRPVGTAGEAVFVPHRAASVSQAGGGVATALVPHSPPSLAVYDPRSPAADAQGLVHLPNVSLDEELVTQLMALRGFQANLKVIEAEDEMLGRLLDVKS